MRTPITSVELIAAGYEWTCPNCEQINKEIEVTERVECDHCHANYDVAAYEHAIG